MAAKKTKLFGIRMSATDIARLTEISKRRKMSRAKCVSVLVARALDDAASDDRRKDEFDAAIAEINAMVAEADRVRGRPMNNFA